MAIDPSERTFDRLPEFDPKSKQYGIRSVAGPSPALRSKTWFFGGAPWRSGDNLDQGREGACVGFGWTQELICSPAVKRFRDASQANGYARCFYFAAQKLDEFPGENYEGTSVLAGAKVAQARGYLPEYRWAFGIDDLLLAISQHGPAVVGTDWTDEMDHVLPNGLLSGTGGSVRGGHCYLVRGLILTPPTNLNIHEPVLRVTNSWGEDYGVGGDVFVKVSDFEKLLKDGGEACIPMRRDNGTAL
jgi:hypothetical protein